MKNFISTLLLLCTFSAISNPGDTTWVNAHVNTNMVWYEQYKDTASFPSTNTSYHKILMYYTLGCASGGCSAWDYTTRVTLLRATGLYDSTVASIDTISTSPLVIDTNWTVFEVKEPFELGRVMTPYAGGFNAGWSMDYVFDVTDYYPLLKGNVEIQIFYQGWDKPRGFSGTLKFALIEGPRPHEVTDIKTLYHGYGDYITSASFESAHLPPKSINIDPATTHVMLRANFSGHGFVNALNCAEFCEKDYYVKANGATVATQTMWRDDCGLNPIWPQAGTWVYDRANWCPGTKSLSYDHDLSTFLSGTSMDIDVDIENYVYTVPSGEVPAGYNYAVQLFQYKDPIATHDVELEAILAPSDENRFARLNPICGNALVKIRNKGSQILTSCTIEYGIQGGAVKTFNWAGNLDFMESAIVELPFGDPADWQTYLADKKFIADAKQPNGTLDENQLNNVYRSNFKQPEVFPADITLSLSTNLMAAETHWKLSKLDGTLISSGDNLTNSTTYTENFSLAPGCYIFHLEDRAKDGLSYPFNFAGNGFVRFRNNGGNFFIKNFNANFGTEIKYHFTVGYGIGLQEEKYSSYLDIFPNPAKGDFNVEILTNGSENISIQLYTLRGEILMEKTMSTDGTLKETLDLKYLPKGVYILKARVGQDVYTKKLSLQ